MSRVLGAFERSVGLVDDVQDAARPFGALVTAHERLVGALLDAKPTEREVLLRALRTMLRGQRAELAPLVPSAATQRRRASDASAAQKSGALVAAYAAVCLLSLGRRSPALIRLARRFGTSVQRLSDLAALLASDASEDWRLRRSTRALSEPLDDPRTAATARSLLRAPAGASDAVRAYRQLAHEIGAPDQVVRSIARLDADIARAPIGRPTKVVLSRHCGALLVRARRLVRLADAAPHVRVSLPAMRSRVRDSVAAALGFLQRTGAIDETDEVHRWGLFGHDLVIGDVFGRLLVIEALAPTPVSRCVPLQSWLDHVVARFDDDGLRYYPGRREIPVDSDDAGVFLQALAAVAPTGRNTPSEGRARRARAARAARATIARCSAASGFVHTWDSVGSIGPTGLAWVATPCPAVSANAWLGIGRRPAAAAIERLGRASSPHYTPVAARCLVARLRRRTGRAPLSSITAPDNALERALTLRDLAVAPAHREDMVAALLDAQDVDGGFPACPLFRTIARVDARWYASRTVTTAFALRALCEVDPVSPGLTVPGRVAAGTELAGM